MSHQTLASLSAAAFFLLRMPSATAVDADVAKGLPTGSALPPRPAAPSAIVSDPPPAIVVNQHHPSQAAKIEAGFFNGLLVDSKLVASASALAERISSARAPVVVGYVSPTPVALVDRNGEKKPLLILNVTAAWVPPGVDAKELFPKGFSPHPTIAFSNVGGGQLNEGPPPSLIELQLRRPPRPANSQDFPPPLNIVNPDTATPVMVVLGTGMSEVSIKISEAQTGEVLLSNASAVIALRTIGGKAIGSDGKVSSLPVMVTFTAKGGAIEEENCPDVSRCLEKLGYKAQFRSTTIPSSNK